jgi:hypothetical protein
LGDFAGGANLNCPMNSFSISLEDGTYLLRVQLPEISTLGSLPWRTLDTNPVVINGSGVEQNVLVQAGQALGGGATFDGNPLEGVPVDFVYEEIPGFGAAFGNSGTGGGWVDFFGRSPMIVQAGIRVFAFGCDLLGATVIEGFPSTGFLFPDERNALNCTLEAALAGKYTHDSTRLLASAGPGDIGYLEAFPPERGGGGACSSRFPRANLPLASRKLPISFSAASSSESSPTAFSPAST